MFAFASPRDVFQSLYQLRWIAVGGQLAAIYLASSVFKLNLPIMHLLLGVAVLGAFNIASWLRLRFARPITVGEVFIQMMTDVGVLSYLMALTGGAANPYFPLHLVPMALASVTLPISWVVAVAGVTLACATLTIFFHLPLPTGIADPDSNLHRLGTWTSFALCLALLTIFLVAIAGRSRKQARAMQELRDRSMRNESVVALASQAASVAHELNTPLSTVANIVADLKFEYSNDEELGPDLNLMDDQLRLCRDYIRELVELSRADAAAKPQPIARVIDAAVSQFRLLRPAVKFNVTDGPRDDQLQILADRSVVHLVVGLLNNAADASRPVEEPLVDMTWFINNHHLRVEVRDYGPGLTSAQRDLAGSFGVSTKPNGLGLGLSLGHLTTERFAGSLVLTEADGTGTVAVFELPLV
jgi:two-component system, sensor histidine kinase RegB